jgi:hypothetical protein
MARSFDMSADYESHVERVHQAFSDEEYWLARLANSGADDATLDSMRIGEDGSIDVVTTQILRRDRLPGIVTQFHRGDLRIEREETWSPVTGDRANATVSGSIPGAPVAVSGKAVLAPVKGFAANSRLEFRASVEVRIPLVGGKIEDFIGSQLVNLLIAEQRFTTLWIAENG